MSGWWYLIERCDGKLLSIHQTRHEAAGMVARCHGCQSSWYDIIPVSAATWLHIEPRVRADTFDPHPCQRGGVA